MLRQNTSPFYFWVDTKLSKELIKFSHHFFLSILSLTSLVFTSPKINLLTQTNTNTSKLLLSWWEYRSSYNHWSVIIDSCVCEWHHNHMDLSWWFRRTTKSSTQHNPNPNPPKPQDEEQLGITEQLIDFVKSFTFDTFKNFPLQGNNTWYMKWNENPQIYI